MRTPALFASFLLSALVAPVLASPHSQQAPPQLRGADCMSPTAVRGFVEIDDRRILVDAGNKRYRIEVSGSCWNLDTTPEISFRGDPISNRVCGSTFDLVLVRNSNPCKIIRMELISKQQYKEALRER